ncbi:Electron transport complex protein RnfD [uncultured Candidatus Thioglobus sp.]|nr:Electron transport complex protein RnfD [uncultured Candidatus Thioglobus sp.]
MHAQTTVKTTMRQVIFALIPGLIASVWILGWGVIIHCILAVACALIIEQIMGRIKDHKMRQGIWDESSIITGLLFALSITPFAPWWVTITGVCFAMIVAKHLYGGLGENIFNPAMSGYAFVLICFPLELSHWPALYTHTFTQDILIPWNDMLMLPQNLDSISGATPLTFNKLQINNMVMLSEIPSASLFSLSLNQGWGWLNLVFLIGGLWLLVKKIIPWQIPVTIICTLVVLSTITNLYDPERYNPAIFHVLTGGFLLAVFFIATDPVTSATTPFGKIIYAVGIGILIYCIRAWGSYSDGIAFSILIMNAAVPLIDAMTQPNIFGKKITP